MMARSILAVSILWAGTAFAQCHPEYGEGSECADYCEWRGQPRCVGSQTPPACYPLASSMEELEDQAVLSAQCLNDFKFLPYYLITLPSLIEDGTLIAQCFPKPPTKVLPEWDDTVYTASPTSDFANCRACIAPCQFPIPPIIIDDPETPEHDMILAWAMSWRWQP